MACALKGGRRGRVVELELGELNLLGTVTPALGNLTYLRRLGLSRNRFHGVLPPELEIQQNNFSGVLPPDVGSKLPKLTDFLVSQNNFHGVLPSSLCNASMLQEIQTNDNFLPGTIPQCLGIHLSNMSIVALAANQFEITDDGDWGFMTSLTNCSNLKELEISANKLHGVLPDSIGNLSTGTKSINIANNNITGKITEGKGNLINLRELYMEYNMIIGPIPASLGKLKMLTELHILNNALSGSIPETLGNLTKLATLTLGTNVISGAIPDSLCNCPLEVLDLSYNNLSGPIPKEIFSISSLSSFLHLSHNSLFGTLPSEVGNLKNLGDLDFSNNRISGEIPTSIGDCQSLEYLITSGNILEGTIPLSLSEVPKIGVFLNLTTTLIIGNDGLCGVIPLLKLPLCSNHTSKKLHRKLDMIVSLCCAFAFVTLVFALSLLYQKSQKTKANLQRAVMGEQYMRVCYAELASATGDFSSNNLIGAGSFGTIYKGTMRDKGRGVVVAVKILNLMQRGARQSFIATCETLRCARHRNLVKILTKYLIFVGFQSMDWATKSPPMAMEFCCWRCSREKRPTDREFGEAIGLRKYVQNALPDRVSTVVDQRLLTETKDGEAAGISGNRDMRIAGVSSILDVGICCSEEMPTDRPPIGEALKKLQTIKDKFLKNLCSEGASSSR
ncbi:putative LRR receptor-like serine/threonine-protein kinase [Dichanthelium oligosanthes]|uniref:Putative LRR receptor-like serine/threonine-protein kinase n=1 Tax=Dichanthelium oligosanthes TaxID=888268 RepID=A0A1E5W2H9_9POAL|nr:putative LRR receptor-like serine/threonine-protein kinase [Dichanthelium oligosanthes]